MKYYIAALTIILFFTACSPVVPPPPEQISPPASEAPVDHSRYENMDDNELLAAYRSHLEHSAHLMNQDDALNYVEMNIKNMKDRYSQSEDSLRRSVIAELSLRGRNVYSELSPPLEPEIDDFAHVQTIQCYVHFDDENALSGIYNEAKTTFAVWTESGNDSCSDDEGSSCWIYKQDCGFGDIRYEEYPFGAQNHFHLSFQDPNIDCYDFDTGGMGKTQGDGSCSAAGIDYGTANRFAQGHLKNHYQRLWVDDSGAKVFSVDRVRVRGTRPAYISFKKTDGSWWAWRNLEPANYNLGDWVNGVVEMRFKGGEESEGVTGIDDIRIRRTLINGE